MSAEESGKKYRTIHEAPPPRGLSAMIANSGDVRFGSMVLIKSSIRGVRVFIRVLAGGFDLVSHRPAYEGLYNLRADA